MKGLFPQLRVPLHVLGHPHHQRHRLHRVAARSGFGREHDRIGPVENGVGHVRGFGPGGPGIAHHTFEHLGGGDHRLARLVAAADDALLDQRHLLRTHFHPQVAPGHHDAVGHLENGVEVGDRLGLFDLGDDPQVRLFLEQQILQGRNVGGPPDEGKGKVVDLLIQAEAQVRKVLVGHGRGRNPDPGQIDPLAVLEQAADHHPAPHLIAGGGEDLEFHQAIVKQDAVAHRHICGQLAVGGGDHQPLPFHLAGGDDHLAAGSQFQNPALHATGADLGPLQIAEDSDRLAPLNGQLTDILDPLCLISMATVRKIEPEHIGPGLHQSTQLFFIGRGRPYRCNDLGSPEHASSPQISGDNVPCTRYEPCPDLCGSGNSADQ